ncbi:BURP domain-containing protein BNM2A [Camellia lanceoleosa]|nr:BURP domain-containing protein BNM2A [Camellia lanceoleosa]
MRSHLNLGISKPQKVSDDTVKAVADTSENSNFLKVSEDELHIVFCQDTYLNTDAGTMSSFEHGQVGLGYCFLAIAGSSDLLTSQQEDLKKSLRERRKDGHWIRFLERLALSTSCDNHIRAHSSSHMDHIDPSLIMFFFLEDLKVGKRIPIYFPKRDPSSSPHFLPKEESDSIPFSLELLPNLLRIFSFPQGSPQAQAMESTLRQCEVKPIKGESKTCATSLESMLDFGPPQSAISSHLIILCGLHHLL